MMCWTTRCKLKMLEKVETGQRRHPRAGQSASVRTSITSNGALHQAACALHGVHESLEHRLRGQRRARDAGVSAGRRRSGCHSLAAAGAHRLRHLGRLSHAWRHAAHLPGGHKQASRNLPVPTTNQMLCRNVPQTTRPPVSCSRLLTHPCRSRHHLEPELPTVNHLGPLRAALSCHTQADLIVVMQVIAVAINSGFVEFPTGYDVAWHQGNVSIWQPRAPPGYAPVGCLFGVGSEPPPLSAVVCVHQKASVSPEEAECHRYNAGLLAWRDLACDPVCSGASNAGGLRPVQHEASTWARETHIYGL